MGDEYLPDNLRTKICATGAGDRIHHSIDCLPPRMNMPIIAESPSTEKQLEYSKNIKQNL